MLGEHTMLKITISKYNTQLINDSFLFTIAQVGVGLYSFMGVNPLPS